MSKGEERHDGNGAEMPCVEVIVSGTMALMTGFAMSGSEQHRGLMVRKIRSNLFFLMHHPALSQSFFCVVQNMHAHWCALEEHMASTAVNLGDRSHGPDKSAVSKSRMFH